jgi:hypothetical protein
MKDVMNLTNLAVVALALGGGVVGLVMLGLWAFTDFGPHREINRATSPSRIVCRRLWRRW